MGQNQQSQENTERMKENLSKIKQKYIVLSGKGGVGKSTVSVNIAVALNLMGKKVGIMDVDIHGPSIAKMTGVSGQHLEMNEKGNPVPIKIKDGFYVMTIASLLESDDTPVVWRGPVKMSAIKQFLNDIEWPELDYLIIDCPPGTGDEPLSAVQLIGQVDGSIIVSTPQEVAFLDARKTINFSQMLKVPVLGLVENMSGFKCPHCGEITDIFKSGGAEKAAADFNIKILGKVPFEIEMVQSGDSGEFYIEKYPESEGAKVYRNIVLAEDGRFQIDLTGLENTTYNAGDISSYAINGIYASTVTNSSNLIQDVTNLDNGDLKNTTLNRINTISLATVENSDLKQFNIKVTNSTLENSNLNQNGLILRVNATNALISQGSTIITD